MSDSRSRTRTRAKNGTSEGEPAARASDESVDVVPDIPGPRPMGEEDVTPEVMAQAWEDPKLANVVYHDWEAGSYDHKWSVDYDERCREYVSDRFAFIAGREGWPYGKALELGSGTGFFSLNLKAAGVIDELHVTDLSPGMVDVIVRNGADQGFTVHGKVADAEQLPYDDDTFDLVFGHAMLHHIPDVELALKESLRVLKPGGRLVFAGEPTVIGDWVARRLGRVTWEVVTALTRLPGLGRFRRSAAELAEESEAARLEAVVDLHVFDPGRLRQMAVDAGAADVGVATEQLTASWFGWPVRTVEAAIPREHLGVRWAFFAYRTWQTLSAFDDRYAARVVPQRFFYNVLVTGTKPVGSEG